ncbi:hypothetical protein IFR04_006145 [Cadophora malorum]|uniref:DUF7580 domain-containing protein n=1 Tax=Cadophora malorum TaxID=108018 RepID=A0A8H7TJE8_9HELO|nr:hypothetical protein IFR04_006145 [Cadophora malorum]
MSGIEAAGLVLGAWPLVVNLVTLYNSGKNGQEWELILHEVKTEELIYVECIESLLQADVPESVLLQLSSRQKPNHLLWKDPELQRNLENRLGTKRFPVVLQTLQNMDLLLNVLNEKLKGLEIPSDTSHPKLRSGLRNIRVNLPHASIKDNIRKLHKCNKLLQRIITPRSSNATVPEAPNLQPEILTKLPPDTLRRMTEDANALHRAIGDGYSCSCPGGHEAHLGIHPLDDLDIAQPYELLFPVDEETALEITSDVVASPISSTTPDNMGRDIDRKISFPSRRWSHRGSMETVQSPLISQGTVLPTVRRRSVSFSQTPSPENSELIEDLCRFIRKLGEEPPTGAPASCLGVLGLNKDKYTVKVTSLDGDGSSHPSSFVCLDDFLPPAKKWNVDRKKRMDLALNLSLAILQFYSTPWIDSWWTWKDFCVLKGDKSQIFVTKRFYSTHSPLATKFDIAQHSASTPVSVFWDCIGEPVLTRLGFALVELALGRRLCELRGEDQNSIDDEDMLDLFTAKDLVDREVVLNKAGKDYNAAVRACLWHQIVSEDCVTGLDSKHRDFKRDMERFIVAPIENYYVTTWGKVSGC